MCKQNIDCQLVIKVGNLYVQFYLVPYKVYTVFYFNSLSLFLKSFYICNSESIQHLLACPVESSLGAPNQIKAENHHKRCLRANGTTAFFDILNNNETICISFYRPIYLSRIANCLVYIL